MFRTIFGTKQVNSGKNWRKHKSKQTCFGLIEENMELSHTHLAVKVSMRHQKIFEPLCRAVDSAVQWWQQLQRAQEKKG